jgi:hypothetical protein
MSTPNNRYSEDESDDKLDCQLKSVERSSKRSWDGYHLEYERERTFNNTSSHVAVDLEQFRNQQIGVGYQAKHVVRQRSAPASSIATHDMTIESARMLNSKRIKLNKSDKKIEKDQSTESRLQKYLLCEGLRKFRKELDLIESTT